MLATVAQTISGRLVISPHVSAEISVDLRYLRDDPFAVHLAFPAAVSLEGEDVEWVFARELLDDGLYAPSGDGDVHLWPCDADRVVDGVRIGARRRDGRVRYGRSAYIPAIFIPRGCRWARRLGTWMSTRTWRRCSVSDGASARIVATRRAPYGRECPL